MNLNFKLYEAAFRSVSLGLIILNNHNQIVSWNDWMVQKTNLSEEATVGKTLDSLFPDMNYDRFHWALEQTFDFGAPQVLSQILNHYLVPIALEKDMYMHLGEMQQHVEILPIKNDEEWYALVVIQDVTHMVHQRNVLMQMGKKFEEETYHDALTSTYNRRFLWSYLDKLIAWSLRESSSIGCIIFDLDHFKKINDEFGHDKGDQVLIYFVSLINKIIRPSDAFVRYGGEEFIIIIPSASVKMVTELASRILTTCRDKSAGSEIGKAITCSAGIAIWQPEKPYLTPKELVDLADKALYQAKNEGRDCYRMANG